MGPKVDPSKARGWFPTQAKLRKSLIERKRAPLLGPRLNKIILDPIKDRWLVERFLELVPDFSMRKAYAAKATLGEVIVDEKESRTLRDKIQHLLHCWWKLRLLTICFKHHKDYRDYVLTVYRTLFLPDKQKEYKDFLDFEVASLEEKNGRIQVSYTKNFYLYSTWRAQRVASNSRVDKWSRSKNPWVKFLRNKHIGLQWLIPVSYLPWYEMADEFKTKKLTSLPYSNTNEGVFSTLVEGFLKRYAPEKIFLPSFEACLRVGSQRYNDGGVVKKDSELPENSWTSHFKLQKFMTGPLTPREVWLPGRAIKANNSFWFVVVEQLLKKVPFYAYNYDTVEKLHQSMKTRLKGGIAYFDVSGYGIQYPRPLLSIIVKKIRDLYFEAPTLRQQADFLLDLLDSVEIEDDPGHFIRPEFRGIGLGYYENMKTLGVLAILATLDPISIYGDQGLLPCEEKISDDEELSRLKGESFGPRKELEKYGFYFKDASKAPQISSADLGIPWSGVIMNSSKVTYKKFYLPLLGGALSGEYHWERKAALASLELPEELMYMWNFLSFQYEIAFGYEFEPGDSIAAFRNCGVNPLVPEIVGNSKSMFVHSFQSPKEGFTSEMVKSLHPTRNPIPAKAAKEFQLKRLNAYKKTKNVPNSYSIDRIKPRIELNRDKEIRMSAYARQTPFWQAIRLLYIDGVDTGTITSGLSLRDARNALTSHNLATNPFEAKASGGYKVISRDYIPAGPAQELVELVDFLEEANEYEGVCTFRKDTFQIPPVDSITSGVPEEAINRSIFALKKDKNPYLQSSLISKYLVGESLIDMNTETLDLESFKSIILSQMITQTEAEVPFEETFNWRSEEEATFTDMLDPTFVGAASSDAALEDLESALDDVDETYRPHSPSPQDIVPDRTPMMWQL
jgi:hypothetical protein